MTSRLDLHLALGSSRRARGGAPRQARPARWLRAVAAAAALGAGALGCQPPAPEDTPLEDLEAAELHWVAPLGDVPLVVGDPIELAVYTGNPEARAVRFAVDGVEVDACDPSAPDEDCRADGLWFGAARFDAPGAHTVTASFATAAGTTVQTTQIVQVEPAGRDLDEDPDDGADEPDPLRDDELIDEGTGTYVAMLRTDRGYLDPTRDFHSAFGGREWAVRGQRVVVRGGRLDGSVADVTRCWARYGASIRRYGDVLNVSRGTMVAATLAAGNCARRAAWDGSLSRQLLRGRLCAFVARAARLTPEPAISAGTCRQRMLANADFAYAVTANYLARRSVRRVHRSDPPRIAAVLDAGGVRRSRANPWHMRSRPGAIDRFVAAYNAYRTAERRGRIPSGDNPARLGAVRLAASNIDPNRMGEPAYAAAASNFTGTTAMAFWADLEPTPRSYVWGPLEQRVRYAQERGLVLKGHTLIWGADLPITMPAHIRELVAQLASTDRAAAASARAALLDAIQAHVFEVVSHFRGRVAQWDVVNEALAHRGHGDGFALRGAFAPLGLEYIVRAFRAARAADPAARLIYNDAGIEGPGDKFEALLRMLRALRAQGAPIDAVGLQSHITAVAPPTFADNMARLGALGLRVYISELDVGTRGLPAGANVADRQARTYYDAVTACVESPFCDQVTVWGVHDEPCGAMGCTDWYDTAFGEDHQLLFDNALAPKPALCAARDALAGRPYVFNPACR